MVRGRGGCGPARPMSQRNPGARPDQAPAHAPAQPRHQPRPGPSAHKAPVPLMAQARFSAVSRSVKPGRQLSPGPSPASVPAFLPILTLPNLAQNDKMPFALNFALCDAGIFWHSSAHYSRACVQLALIVGDCCLNTAVEDSLDHPRL